MYSSRFCFLNRNTVKLRILSKLLFIINQLNLRINLIFLIVFPYHCYFTLITDTLEHQTWPSSDFAESDVYYSPTLPLPLIHGKIIRPNSQAFAKKKFKNLCGLYVPSCKYKLTAKRRGLVDKARGCYAAYCCGSTFTFWNFLICTRTTQCP